MGVLVTPRQSLYGMLEIIVILLDWTKKASHGGLGTSLVAATVLHSVTMQEILHAATLQATSFGLDLSQSPCCVA